MEQVDIAAELRADNPRARELELITLADSIRVYCEASDNVRRNGAIVAHPRTGAPIENPYLKIQNGQASRLTRAKSIKSDRVVRLLLEQLAAQPAEQEHE